MTNPATIAKVQERHCNLLIEHGWFDTLRFFVKSLDYIYLLNNLATELKRKHRWSPPAKDFFKPFEHCRPESLKLVIAFPEPHLDPTLNTGMPLEYPIDMKEPWQMGAFKEEILRVFGTQNLKDNTLKHLTAQGVLVINTTITTRVAQGEKHRTIWEPFVIYLFDLLNRSENICWLFVGPNNYHRLIDNPTHLKLFVPPLPEKKPLKWKTDDILLKINEFLVQKNKSEIIW